jgi:prepilin-type processing-associated H-X9-DG protein
VGDSDYKGGGLNAANNWGDINSWGIDATVGGTIPVQSNPGVFCVLDRGDYDAGITFAGAGLDSNPKEYHSNMAAIKDGTSNTVMFSEGLKSTNANWGGTLGEITHGDMGASLFTTFTTPNSSVPDHLNQPCPLTEGDTSYPAPCQDSSQNLSNGATNPFYNSSITEWNEYAAARSNHSGGVNAALADGSVRFITDKISVITWHQLGTRAGHETVTGDW